MDYTMKLSTLLLSSAALLVAGAAYAADLPAKKAAPAKAPTGCAAFGAGYIAVPGGDTCLKISGYVRANDTYLSNQARGTAPYGLAGDYGLQFDVQNQTEAGAVKSTIFFESGSNGATNHNPGVTDAYVSLGGLSAGKLDSMFDIGGGYNHTGDAYGPHPGQIMYTMPVGAASISIAAVTAEDNNGTTYTDVPAVPGKSVESYTTNNFYASRPDINAAVSTAVGALKVTAGVASHEVVGSTSGSAQGYAFIGKATYDAGVASFLGYAAYSNGALKYTGGSAVGSDSLSDASGLSKGTQYQAEIDVPVGKNDSIGVFAESISASASVAGANDNTYSKTQYGAALKHTIGNGLWIRPEIYTETVKNTGSADTTTNGAYIRIERDF
jgi:Porin subfamily